MLVSLVKELDELHFSEGDCYETTDGGGGYTSGLEEKEDSFADINDIFGDK